MLTAAWGPWWELWWHGALAGHMLQHLMVMNGGALLFAAALRPRRQGLLALSTVMQIALLWGWHVPPVYEAAAQSPLLAWSMQVSLLSVAFLFWGAVLAHPVEKSWQAILAALVTAKAMCLFGAILCFARLPIHALHGDHGGAASALDDQQLAGLFMMASCAVVYVVAAVVLFLRWMGHLAAAGADRWRPADA